MIRPSISVDWYSLVKDSLLIVMLYNVLIQNRARSSDEGLTLEISANTLFTAYPHQPYVDTLYVLPPR